MLKNFVYISFQCFYLYKHLTSFDVSRVGFDIALVDSTLNEEVACESPRGTPRISDDPVIHVVLPPIANNDHCVVMNWFRWVVACGVVINPIPETLGYN